MVSTAVKEGRGKQQRVGEFSWEDVVSCERSGKRTGKETKRELVEKKWLDNKIK